VRLVGHGPLGVHTGGDPGQPHDGHAVHGPRPQALQGHVAEVRRIAGHHCHNRGLPEPNAHTPHHHHRKVHAHSRVGTPMDMWKLGWRGGGGGRGRAATTPCRHSTTHAVQRLCEAAAAVQRAGTWPYPRQSMTRREHGRVWTANSPRTEASYPFPPPQGAGTAKPPPLPTTHLPGAGSGPGPVRVVGDAARGAPLHHRGTGALAGRAEAERMRKAAGHKRRRAHVVQHPGKPRSAPRCSAHSFPSLVFSTTFRGAWRMLRCVRADGRGLGAWDLRARCRGSKPKRGYRSNAHGGAHQRGAAPSLPPQTHLGQGHDFCTARDGHGPHRAGGARKHEHNVGAQQRRGRLAGGHRRGRRRVGHGLGRHTHRTQQAATQMEHTMRRRPWPTRGSRPPFHNTELVLRQQHAQLTKKARV
jgi:hypothetical protein